MVVAQLAEWSLPTPGDQGLSPFDDFFIERKSSVIY